MAEYKSRRERRLAQVSKAGGSKSPAAIALIVDVSKKPKKKDGGSVEGDKARHHLGKRARGGATDEPRKTKQLDAREAALYSNGVDKVAEGSHREEREVPEEEREDGDDATNKVDDFYLKTWDGSINPKQMFLARPSKFGADADYRRADGGSVAKSKFEVDDDSSQNKGDLGPSRGKAPQYENDEDKDKRARGGHIKRRADGGETDYDRFSAAMNRAKNLRGKDWPANVQGADIALDAMRRAIGKSTMYPEDQPEGYPIPTHETIHAGSVRDEKAKGGWIGPAREKMERKGTVGSLHKALHVSEGTRIPNKRLEEARKDAGPALRKKIQFAENVRK